MKVKTYVFDDVQKGIEILKSEYGPDTIIIEVKENIKNGSRKTCEISVAVDNGSQPSEYDPVRTREKTEDIWNYTTKSLLDKIALFESDIIMDRLKSYPLSLRFIYDKMVENGFNAQLAMTIISEVYSRIGELAKETVRASYFLKDLLGEKIKISETMSTDDSVILLGPSGAGKTQTAKKLAIILSALGKSVSIVAYNPVNSESCYELKAFSKDVGIPFSFTAQVDELYSILEKDRRKKIIDIPGSVTLQKGIVEKLKDVKRIMLLPAGARDEKIRNYFNQFNDLNTAELIFTKLDEEETLGHICHNLIVLKQPVCCFTTGANIRDIVMPSKELFYKILFEGNKWKRDEGKPLQ
ncbi:MAG: hypothetical protein NTX36_15050 [Proteobacteria bacterium]|nr:hypothetical protein [Pseudomonadota bacterium]